MTDKKPFLVRLTPAQRETLEAIRIKMGARSASEAVSRLIDAEPIVMLEVRGRLEAAKGLMEFVADGEVKK